MKKVSSPESATSSAGKPPPHPKLIPPPSGAGGEPYWFDDACILDMDYFVKTISGIKSKGVRPDLIGSIIAHYASKWLPELSGGIGGQDPPHSPPSESVTAAILKKRFFVETLIGILPPENGSVPCNFLLRLLRSANSVGADASYSAELERRISWQLDQASLKEIMIPSFSHTCGTLLDVGLVVRLVRRFVGLDGGEGVSGGAAMVKVAKLVDSYLAEAAVDASLSLPEFVALGGALPSHARATDDGLYRAIDTYLKAHPQMSKQERKVLCRLIDSRKLTTEASFHAAQNERLPVRAVIQVLFSEQTKLSRHIDWSGSFTRARSPNPTHCSEPGPIGPGPARCLSKREMNAQQAEIRRLRDDVVRLQSQCSVIHAQLEKAAEKKSSGGGSKGFLRWRKFGLVPTFKGSGVSVNVEKMSNEGIGDSEQVDRSGYENRTPGNMKTKLVQGKNSNRWRKSMS